MLIPLPFPISGPLWVIGGFSATREVLWARIGLPHHSETDGLNFGGEEDWWAFLNEEGERLVLCLLVPYHDVIVLSDPADYPTAETDLVHAIGDSVYSAKDPVLYN